MDKNSVPKRSSLMPEIEETNRTFKDGVKRNRLPEPSNPYIPEDKNLQSNFKEESNDLEEFQLALEEYQLGRTMIGVQRMQKVEYDALLDLFSDQFEYNYELLGAMMDQMINNLDREQRLEFQDIVQKKKLRLVSSFKKSYYKKGN
ncbi:hypothetical protein [Enterococcus rivorum]|uniref:Uncharacterized protein n=1 Tax=Enterococcus rivorum TaxID=762845 RepID=A0A1E5L0K8_9ENTE|nr:hypothetical protein [Enterococcus rivorum]MBP2098888.1 hypothetical protein [Enterococcus rivorum]OEH83614.1 hypothetical protein BCR26_09050 [Enterococcus rivorum]